MKRTLVILLLLAAASVAKAETNWKPEDFAYGISMVGDGQASIYEAALPPDVYRGVTRGDLGDLRVFNKDGEIVPHALDRKPAQAPNDTQWEPLGFFPLYEGTKQTPERLSLIIRHEAGDSTVDVSAMGAPESTKKIAGYLLDASNLQSPIRALSLNLSGGQNFILKADLEASDDLKTWKTVAEDAVIAYLTEGGRILKRNSFEFPATKAAYFRLSLKQAADTGVDVADFSAQTDGGLKAPESQWIDLSGELKEGEVVFDSGGYFPADRIEVMLPEASMLIDAEIRSSLKSGTSGTPGGRHGDEFSGPVFRLTEGKNEVSSGPIHLDGDRTAPRRYWYLKPRQAESRLGTKPPTLRLGWITEKIAFVAQGQGPYLLAYGSAVVRPADFGVDALLQRTDSSVRPATVKLGKQIQLGGPQRLVLPPPRRVEVWKKALAVSFMGLGTLVLGLMAYRLIRQMGSEIPE